MKTLGQELLIKLVSIPSFVGDKNPGSEIKIIQFLNNYFSNNFPDFELFEVPFEGKRRNLLFKNANDVKILFACHMDTVPPSSNNAFTLEQKGDRAYGLGTKDMKGGIVSTILTLHGLTHIPKGVGILFYGDEETTFKGISAIVKKSKKLFPNKPEIIISPESRFNLGVGARGIMVIDLKAYGKRAHSARPHLGVDAVKLFIQAISKTEELINRKSSKLGKTTITIPSMHSGLLEPDGSIGVHVGTVPDFTQAIVSVRNAHQQMDAKGFLKILKSQCKKVGLKLTAKIKEDYPARIARETEVKRVSNLILKAGFIPEIANPTISGFNDVIILAKVLQSSVFNFGPYGEGNHTKDEWVSVQSIKKTAKVFEEFIKYFAK